MDLVLYLNGDEGLLTLNMVTEYANVKLIVVPQNYDNDKIIKYATQNKISILIRNQESAAKITFPNTTIISSAFPYKIYPEEINAVTHAVNFHGAILPKYRGRHGNIWAMINDEKTLGVTVHKINNNFDSGEILGINTFEINDDLSLSNIQKKSKEALIKLVKSFIQGNLAPPPDISIPNIYWRQRTQSDSNINWHLSAHKVFLFIRALSREPIYAYSRYGKNIFYFINTEISSENFSNIPGSVNIINDDIYITTGDMKSVKIIEYKTSNDSLNNTVVLH